jgi:hypothetical protein
MSDPAITIDWTFDDKSSNQETRLITKFTDSAGAAARDFCWPKGASTLTFQCKIPFMLLTCRADWESGDPTQYVLIGTKLWWVYTPNNPQHSNDPYTLVMAPPVKANFHYHIAIPPLPDCVIHHIDTGGAGVSSSGDQIAITSSHFDVTVAKRAGRVRIQSTVDPGYLVRATINYATLMSAAKEAPTKAPSS